LSDALLWKLAKVLEGLGLLVVLVGLFWSIGLGMQDRSLDSMAFEYRGLLLGLLLWGAGWLIERRVGRR
jgi:hypothetical protein